MVFCVAYVAMGCTLFYKFFGVVPLTKAEIIWCIIISAITVIGFNWLYTYSTTKAQDKWDALRVPGMHTSTEGE